METDAARDRLLRLVEEHGTSLAALSRMLGKNPSYLQQFVTRGSPRKLEETDRAKLGRFFGIDERELGAPKEISSLGATHGDWAVVPRLSSEASAGPGTMPLDERSIGALRFSARWLRAQGLDPARLSTIAVAGDSMEPTLRDGDEILIDAASGTMRDGVYVVRLEDTLLVKRLELRPGGAAALLSDNPAYRPIECSAADLAIVGRVVWKGGRI